MIEKQPTKINVFVTAQNKEKQTQIKYIVINWQPKGSQRLMPRLEEWLR